MGHTFTNHLYHIVFSTKERRALLTPPLRDRLHQYMNGIARNAGGLLLCINGTRDHVHLLAAIPADVGTVKANSSKWARRTFPDMDGFAWQAGYSSFTVSESLRSKVESYIQSQEEHHRRLPFAGELAELLRRHSVEFDAEHYLD